MKKDPVNKYGIKLSEVKIGIRVDTEDGDNGILERIATNPFPYLVKFQNGSAWTSFSIIRKII